MDWNASDPRLTRTAAALRDGECYHEASHDGSRSSSPGDLRIPRVTNHIITTRSTWSGDPRLKRFQIRLQQFQAYQTAQTFLYCRVELHDEVA